MLNIERDTGGLFVFSSVSSLSRASRQLDFKTRESFPLRGMISLSLGAFAILFDKENSFSRVTCWEKLAVRPAPRSNRIKTKF